MGRGTDEVQRIAHRNAKQFATHRSAMEYSELKRQ